MTQQEKDRAAEAQFELPPLPLADLGGVTNESGVAHAVREYARQAIVHFLETTGQYVTNDATRQAAIDEAIAHRGEAVGKVRHFHYSGIARNGVRQEAALNDDAPELPDGTLLYTAPQPVEPTNKESLTVAEPAINADFPLGAIENGRAFGERLENGYSFECHAGPLRNCSDWQEFRRCFEYLAEWAVGHAPQPAEPVKMTLSEAKRLLGLPEVPSRLSLGNGLTIMGSSAAINAVEAMTEPVKGEPSDEEILRMAHDVLFKSRFTPDADVIAFARALLARCPYSDIGAQPAASAEPAIRDWPAIEAAIDEYLGDYELRGDEGDYRPTEQELLLISDAIHGLLDNDFLALLAAPVAAQSVPDGWKLVPAIADQAMCQAGQEKAREWPRFPLRINPIYQAMLEAAPTPPAAGQAQPESAAVTFVREIDLGAYKPEEIEARAREIVDMLTPLSAVIDAQMRQADVGNRTSDGNQALAAQPDADKVDAELSPEEAAEFITTVDQFEECGETVTDHATLMRWARIGLLECDHFTVTDKGDDFYRDAARAQQEHDQ